MNDKFDELAKGLAQSVTRRGALKRFGVGLAAITLTMLGLRSQADPTDHCSTYADCGSGLTCCNGKCVDRNFDPHNCGSCGHHCPGGKNWQCVYGVCLYDSSGNV